MIADVPTTDERLLRAEERLRLAVEAAQLGVWYADFPFDRIVFGPEVCKHLGLPLGTVVTIEEYFAFVHPDDRQLVRQAIARSIEGGEDYILEYRTLRPSDGRVSWVRATGRCYRDPNGKPHHFDGITYDVTHRKEEEERLRRTEERLRLAVAAGRLAVWYCDLPMRRIDCDPVIKKYLGLAPDDELTVELYYATIHDDDRERVRAAVERAIREGADFDAEYRVLAATGRVRWVRAIGRCFCDASGKPHHFDGIIRDVTREKCHKQRRERLLHELAEANRLRERLLGIVGHDLKSPLATVALTARLLRERVADELTMKSVERILRSTTRMNRLIGQLLDFAQIRACAGMPVDAAPVDLLVLCRQVIDELSAANPQARITLEADCDCDGRWDGDRLSQVMSNLVGNAIQHGDAGVVVVRLRNDGDGVVITVHNGGEPIPVELLPVIFDPFRQGRRREKGQSTSVGLGLYIVREIVVAHGGQIFVKSANGEGTTFTVLLPRQPAVEQLHREEAAELH